MTTEMTTDTLILTETALAPAERVQRGNTKRSELQAQLADLEADAQRAQDALDGMEAARAKATAQVDLLTGALEAAQQDLLAVGANLTIAEGTADEAAAAEQVELARREHTKVSAAREAARSALLRAERAIEAQRPAIERELDRVGEAIRRKRQEITALEAAIQVAHNAAGQMRLAELRAEHQDKMAARQAAIVERARVDEDLRAFAHRLTQELAPWPSLAETPRDQLLASQPQLTGARAVLDAFSFLLDTMEAYRGHSFPATNKASVRHSLMLLDEHAINTILTPVGTESAAGVLGPIRQRIQATLEAYG